MIAMIASKKKELNPYGVQKLFISRFQAGIGLGLVVLWPLFSSSGFRQNMAGSNEKKTGYMLP